MTVYVVNTIRTFPFTGTIFMFGEKKIQYLSQKNPGDLPRKDLNIDVVIESTGFFTNREDAEKHIAAGAKTVVISGPTKSKDTPTVVHGVNTQTSLGFNRHHQKSLRRH